MFYSDDIVQEVVLSNDIVDIVSSYTQLKRSGRGFTGLCPFHNEKTPSFHVSPDKQLYHCFGCGEGGSVIQFVMKTENLDFVEALKFLADRAGIVLPEKNDNPGAADKEHIKKQKNLTANKFAAKFFYDTLMSEEGAVGYDYFVNQRGFSQRTIVHFGLGFAPDSGDKLVNYLTGCGYEKSELVDFGLAVIKGNRIIDKFRNRVMYPIIDLRGNVVAFGGRVMDDSKPKYLNSPDTKAFNKSNQLFALNFAKDKANGKIILAEGYMDVIALHQAGVQNAVATLGTSLTEQQAKMISHYADEVIICYDTDEAGTKATLRAIDIFKNTNLRIKVLTLYGAKDPDEFIKNHGGSAKFLQLLKAAPAATMYKLNLLKQKYDIENNTEEKIVFVTEAAKVLASTKNMVETDAYADKISKECDIRKESLMLEVAKISNSANHKNDAKSGRRSVNSVPKAVREEYRNAQRAAVENADIQKEDGEKKAKIREFKPINVNLLNAEKKLLSLVYTSKNAALRAKEQLGADYYISDIHKRLARFCYEMWQKGQAPNAAAVMQLFSGDEANYVTDILMDKSIYDNENEAVCDLINKIKIEQLEMRRKTETDPAVLVKIVQLLQKLKTGKESLPNG